MLFTTFLVSAASATDLGDITDFSGPRFPRGTLEGAAGAVNYYSFTLSEARDVGLGLRQQETDADLILEDGSGVVLDSSERSGTANEWLRETLLAGTYHVRIEAQEAGVSEYVFRYGVRAADPDEVERLEEEAGQVESVLDSGTWESVSEGDTDLPNDTSTPGRVEVGGSAMGTVGTAGDQDRFAVELEAGRTYRFDLTGSPGGGGTLPDTFFRAIYDSEGRYQPDSYNDDFEGGRDSRVTFTASESGTHYARVSGDRNETGSYTLSVTDVTGQVEAVFVPGPPETELESSPGQSTPGAGGRANVSEGGTDLPSTTSTTGRVEVGGSVTGNIHIGANSDWFGVELVAGKRYQIDLEGAPTDRGTLTDPHLFSIYNAAGNATGPADSNSGVGANARVIYMPAEDGTYFVRAAAWLLATGTYTLSVIELGANGVSEADTDFPEGIEGLSTSGRVEVGGSVTGNINPGTDSDWFRVWLVAGKTYQIDLEGADTSRGTLANPHLFHLYDSSGTEIPNTNNVAGGVGKNARTIYMPTENSTYFFVRAAGFILDTGTYTLSVRDLTPHLEGDTDLADDATTTGKVVVDGLVARGTISEPVGPSSRNFYTFDYDWFRVELKAGKTYRIDLEPVIRDRGDGTFELSLLPEIVAIYYEDSDGDINFLHHTSDRESSGPGYAARVEFTPNASGTYYISASGLGFTSGGYELTVSDITQDDDQHTDNRSTRGRVSVGGEAKGRIDSSGDVDWFSVGLQAGKRYQIDLEGRATGRGSLYDPWLRGIFDANGNEIPGTRDDDGGQGYNSRLTFTPNADGTYTLSVKEAN